MKDHSHTDKPMKTENKLGFSSINNRSKLFLICPDDALEMAIRESFTGDLHCVFSLGAIFDFHISFAEEIDHMVIKYQINKLYVILSSTNTFVRKVLTGTEANDSKAEEILNEVIKRQKHIIEKEANIEQKARIVTEMMIDDQISQIKKAPFLDKRIESGELKLIGLIYDPGLTTFAQISKVPIM